MTEELTVSKSTSLLINDAFALRQRNGVPVFTSIETLKRPYTEQEIENIILNTTMQRKEFGLIPAKIKSYDNKLKSTLEKTPKRIRIKKDYPINLTRLKSILITPRGKGYISTYFFEFAKTHSISIYFIDARGRIEASFIPFHNKNSWLVIKQSLAIGTEKELEIAKYLIQLKLETEDMEHLIPLLHEAKDIKNVLKAEALGATHYFRKWKFDKEWNWDGRHGRNYYHNSNAIDPVNVMLNLGYGLLAQQMSEILIKRGFELSIGFLHTGKTTRSKRYWNRLVYDVIEPYRVWVDVATKEMIAKQEIKPSDFTFADDKSHMVLKDDALKTALEKFLETLSLLEHKSLPIIRTVENML